MATADEPLTPARPRPTLDDMRRCLAEGTGEGIKVAVIDSGVDVAHPALVELGLTTLADDIAIEDDGITLKVSEGSNNDVFGHGTAVSWMVRKMAPKVQIGSVRVLGTNCGARDVGICEGVRQAMDRGYHILNCSFGSKSLQKLAIYKEWVDEAYLKGIHIIAACNNDNYDTTEWPGHFSSVITVNMARSVDELAFYYKPGQLVEFASRGVNVQLPWKGGAILEKSGSSFAAPRVAGLLARILSIYPDLSPLEAKAALQRLAIPWTKDIAGPNVSYSV